ncbi:MAG: sugar phosphate isomerase/epimerase [Proteobacteria bacterium]|nr:sugar phosphate isomerase/epimerase [Pseudomonadota bacterium]
MVDFGIMQGRILPEDLNLLQVFPRSQWENEMVNARELGFDTVELLYDKSMILRNLLEVPENLEKLGILKKGSINNARILSKSICLDYLTELSIFDSSQKKMFWGSIIGLTKQLAGTTISIFVIPFLEKNNLSSAAQLDKLVSLLDSLNIDKIGGQFGIKYCLELNLPASVIKNAFDQSGFKNIKLCYDTGNARSQGYLPEVEIDNLGDVIYHVHIKDRSVGGPNVMLGKGDVDFEAGFKSFERIGYDGLMVLETPYSISPAKEAQTNLSYIKQYIAKKNE